MAAKTKTMNPIRLILQHHAQGFSGRNIAQRLAISRNTVAHYLGRFAASGQSSEALMALEDAALAAICHPAKASPPDDARLAAFELRVSDWLEALRNPKVTRQLLWEEYREEEPDGYGYTQFCERLKRHKARAGVTATFRHHAGQ